MPVEWNAHRFSGGALALSAANSVVHRGVAAMAFDRFDDAAELPSFAAAATQLCEEEFSGATIAVDDAPRERVAIIALREAIDRLFRRRAETGEYLAADLAGLLAAGAQALDGVEARFDASGPKRLPLAAAMTVSALALLEPARAARVRVCPNCRWLFLDRSRNATRLWCDMAVCGNRAKARRHYRRMRDADAKETMR